MKKSTSIESNSAKTVMELCSVFNDLQDFRELPVVLEKTIIQYCHVDWLGMYEISKRNPHINITTNPHLPFDWDELYQEIVPYDSFGMHTRELTEGGVLASDEVMDFNDEKARYAFEFARKHTGTTSAISMMGSKRSDVMLAYGVYRTDEKNSFTEEDRQFFKNLSPFIVNFSKTLELYKNYDYHRSALELLLSDESIRPVLFDEHLNPVEISVETLNAIANIYSKKRLTQLPQPILDWVHQTIAPTGRLIPNSGPFFKKLSFANGICCCRAYIVKTNHHNHMLLIKFRLHESVENFSILKEKGLTPREIEALEYLPLGYSNRQIAMAMDIEEVSAKKHLKNAAQKLGAANRTEMLYQALLEKSLLQYRSL